MEKQGLNHNEYLKLFLEGLSPHEKVKTLNRLFEIATETRKFEIELYWKRANYFWLFVAAFFIGYYQTLPTSASFSIENILITVGGLLFSIGWYFVDRGSKYWQENWEKHIEVLSLELGIPIFEVLKSNKYKVSNLMKSFPYSVSRVNQFLNICVIFFWFTLLCYRVYMIPTSESCCKLVLFFITAIVVVLISIGLHYASRSFVIREKADHDKDFFYNGMNAR